MMPGVRAVVAGTCLVVLGWIGWTTVAATRSDQLADEHPDAALRIDPDNPAALLAAARREARAGNDPMAAALARRLLTIEPGQGEGFAILALEASRRGDGNADALVRMAVRRAARNREMRARAAASALGRGDLPAAMTQLDALLRLGAGSNLYPALAQQSAEPRFAAAMVDTLAAEPRWRNAFLATLLARGPARAIDQVYAGLRRRGALTSGESGHWLRRMMSQGRWGEAYAHWVAMLGPLPHGLPSVYDGGFETDPSGIGFDWQKTARVDGVFTELEPTPGATGARAAHFRFIGPSPGGDLRQALLLGPGRYRLRLRARAEFLHTEEGLEWEITCSSGTRIAALGPLEGSFEWRVLQADFSVPASRCVGQWLELRNPQPSGAGQHASGDLWIDDVAILPLD